ncbi:MAG: carbohydrate kinase family protein [Geminicoccaceae bacterium]
MGERRGFVTGGTWCVDRNKLVDFWPGEDGLAEILATERRGGGSGCNLACDIRRLDPAMPVETIGLVGDDDDGHLLLQQADDHGIDRRQLRAVPGGVTMFTDAYGSKRSGRRTHIYDQGVSAELTPDHFDLASTTSRIFHLGLPGVHRLMDAPWQGDASGWLAVLRKARAAGLITNLELASIPPERIHALTVPCLPELDYLIVNDTEIGAIAGRTTVVEDESDIEACIEAARTVLSMGVRRLVAVHFPRAGFALTAEGELTFKPSVSVPKEVVVAANGAGDAFAAGLLYGLHESWSLDRSLTLAHASAAASLRSMSTTDTVESWQTCLALADGWGWRTAPSLPETT